MFVQIGELLSSEGEDIVIDISFPRGYLNFIERGNEREGIKLGPEGILVVQDCR